jgi:hypothetical protein
VTVSRTPLAALVIVISLTFTGCSPPGYGSGSGGAELDVAQAQLIDLLDGAQAVIGGEWEPLLTGARPCSADGAQGAQVAQLRNGPPLDEGTEQQVAEDLLAVFAEAGFDLTTREVTSQNGSRVIEGQYPASGDDERGRLFQFAISANGSSMLGYSTCVPGDPDVINQERRESAAG